MARRVAWITLALLIALIAMWTWARLTSSPPPRYVTAPVARGDFTVTVTATGSLEPKNVVNVGSEISGRVSRVLVDANDRVERGQVLVELDPDRYQAEVAQARAALAAARASLAEALAAADDARTTRDRAEALLPRGLIPEAERDTAASAAKRAEAAVSGARAEVQRARAALDLAESNLRRAVIRSPIAGIVLTRSVEPGQTVVAALQAPVLFQLAEGLTHMTVSADIDEADVGMVRAGQRATFTVPAHFGRTFEARVTKIHNAAELIDRVVTYEAELEVTNNRLLLRPGMTVTAQIVVEHHPDALQVPNDALRFSPEPQRPGEQAPRGKRVYVLRDGRPAAVPIEVLGENDTQTRIAGGALEKGDRVIINRESP